MARRKSLLQQEIAQSRPFGSAAQEAILALLRTSDQLRRYLASFIEPAGITLQQYNVLRILRGAEPEGLPTLIVASRMIEQAPGITGLIDRLESKDLVVRERATDDRRVVNCRITRAGRDLLTTLDGAIVGVDAVALSGLSEREQRALVRLLEKIRGACTGEAHG
jgi:DNA-binding MarR family transcriptional regulator